MSEAIVVVASAASVGNPYLGLLAGASLLLLAIHNRQ